MRDISTLSKNLSDLIRDTCPQVLFVAMSGSRSNGEQDLQSDLDLALLVKPGPLLQSAQDINARINPSLKEKVFVQAGPTWKEGFGCRTSILYVDGFKIEIFVNSEDTIPTVRRVLKWKAFWGEEHLRPIQQKVEKLLNQERILSKAVFDLSYAHMSICRHISRGELFAANVVISSLTSITLALRLFELGQDYDSVSSYKRIYRDGLIEDKVIAEIAKLAGRTNLFSTDADARSFELLVDMGRDLIGRMKPEAPTSSTSNVQVLLDNQALIRQACQEWMRK